MPPFPAPAPMAVSGPPMPAYAPPPQAMMPAPPIPANSFMHGGMQHLGFEEAYNPMYTSNDNAAYGAEEVPDTNTMADATHRYMMDGVMSIAGYDGGSPLVPFDDSVTPQGGAGFTSTGDPLMDMIITQQMTDNPQMSEQAARAIAEGQRYLYDAQHKTDGSGNAVSWAQLAQAADQFKQKQALDVQNAFDARKIAQYNAAAAQEKATQDWHQAQMDASSKRQNLIESAGAQAQNSFQGMLKYATPGQTFNYEPGLLYEAAKNDSGQTPTSQYPMPQYPSLDFGAQQ